MNFTAQPAFFLGPASSSISRRRDDLVLVRLLLRLRQQPPLRFCLLPLTESVVQQIHMRTNNHGDLDEFFAYVDQAISVAVRFELASRSEAFPGEGEGYS